MEPHSPSAMLLLKKTAPLFLPLPLRLRLHRDNRRYFTEAVLLCAVDSLKKVFDRKAKKVEKSEFSEPNCDMFCCFLARFCIFCDVEKTVHNLFIMHKNKERVLCNLKSKQ